MHKHVLVIICLGALAAGIGCKKPPANEGCTSSGGAIITAECCGETGDFPNTCIDGPCGCAPGNSHEVYSCTCGADQCFDGTACVGMVLYGDAEFFEAEDQGSKQAKQGMGN